jgi:hypothetical protein
MVYHLSSLSKTCSNIVCENKGNTPLKIKHPFCHITQYKKYLYQHIFTVAHASTFSHNKENVCTNIRIPNKINTNEPQQSAVIWLVHDNLYIYSPLCALVLVKKPRPTIKIINKYNDDQNGKTNYTN